VHIELHSGEKRELVFKLGSGLEINVRDDDPVVELKVDGGKFTLRVDRDGAVALESQGDVELKGSEISIEAQDQLNLKGATVNIN
jgi:hypothetical protein